MKLILVIDPQFIENNRYRYSPKHFKVCRKKKKNQIASLLSLSQGQWLARRAQP